MKDVQKWQLLALIVVLGFLIWLLSPVLMPFVAGALLAYLGDPMVDRLERWKLSRSGGVVVVFCLMTLALVGVVLLLIPMLERQIGTIVEQFPKLRDWFVGVAVPWVQHRTGLKLPELDPASLFESLREHWQQAGGLATQVLGGLSKSGLVIINWVLNLALIPVVTFYLLRDWDVMVARIRELLPRPIEPIVSRLAGEADGVLGSFLRGQLSVMLALGVIYAAGMALVGIDLALLIGVVAGLVSFIPYLGTAVGVAMGVIAALVQYGDWWHIALVLMVFGVGQLLEGMVLTPWLVGDRIGMHPVAVIFAVMAGGQLFGFVGVLVALPVAAVLMVLLRYLHDRYTASVLYAGNDGEVSPQDDVKPVPVTLVLAQVPEAAAAAVEVASAPATPKRRRKPRKKPQPPAT